MMATRKASRAISNVILEIFKASLAAVSPTNLLPTAVNVDRYNQLIFSNSCDFTKFSALAVEINVLAFGKASIVMTNAFLETLLSKCSNAKTIFKHGFVLAPKGMRKSLMTLQPKSLRVVIDFEKSGNLTILEGAENNAPDEHAVSNTDEALEFVRQIAPPVDDVVSSVLVMLISGGGSSLLCKPRFPVTLADKQDIIRELACAGATIQEMNCVRRSVSAVKNGKLLHFVPAGVRSIALIVSDVVGDDLATIASGPTYRVPSAAVDASAEKPTLPTDPVEVLRKLGLWPDKVPQTVKTVLTDFSEENSTKSSAECVNLIIGSNSMALEAARHAAQALIPDAAIQMLTKTLVGNADDVGQLFAEVAAYLSADDCCQQIPSAISSSIFWPSLQQLRKNLHEICVEQRRRRPLCILAGGETTVIVRGTGRGGRNQQMVLQFAYFLHTNEYCKKMLNSSEINVTFLSGGTDGQDGPTDAAGAIYSYPAYAMDHGELQLATECLRNNDSYTFWQNFRNGACHVKTSFTGTNVMDIQILLIQ